ncbi:MAG: SufS family cysteine desulfurase [Treponema sp.]|jgi:cysteine desulfurase/selenocysteine lyase|nr:SufS family cysteine desulfurase [Treponema sp.]
MNNQYRQDFPIFSSAENKNLVYLDNAATTQRPAQVIAAVTKFYETDNANPLRGLYGLSVRATEVYENARHTAARFIHAAEDCEIIFTRNATESLNLVAYSYGLSTLKAGDEVVVSVMEHHSNLLPWQMACRRTGAKLVFLECDKKTGSIPPEEFTSKIGPQTKIVALAHVSNVLGTTNPIKAVAALAHRFGAVIVVDGAQSAPHLQVDVQNLDVDFFAFSGHKLCAPMGIGVLYAKKRLLENMPPFLTGGEMIEYVTRESATYAELPHKFEAGTVNAAGAAGLAAAIRYIQSVGMKNIIDHDNKLASLMIAGMQSIPGLRILGTTDGTKRCGIVTFTLDGVHPHDMASLLDTDAIAVRAGHHCAQPLMQYMGTPSTARASVYFYNTEDEIAYFIDKLKNVRKEMGYGA